MREKRAIGIRESWEGGKYNLLDGESSTASIFKEYVQRTTLKYGDDASKELIHSTSQLLSSSLAFNDAIFAYHPDFNGLVVGSIQSGKSASFLGLVSSSIDQGVKAVFSYTHLTLPTKRIV